MIKIIAEVLSSCMCVRISVWWWFFIVVWLGFFVVVWLFVFLLLLFFKLVKLEESELK